MAMTTSNSIKVQPARLPGPPSTSGRVHLETASTAERGCGGVGAQPQQIECGARLGNSPLITAFHALRLVPVALTQPRSGTSVFNFGVISISQSWLLKGHAVKDVGLVRRDRDLVRQ